MNTGKLSRRDFLRAAAAGAAGAAVTGVLPAFAEEDLIAPAPASDLMTWEKKEQEKWAFEVAPDPIPEADIRENCHRFRCIGPLLRLLRPAFRCGRHVVLRQQWSDRSRWIQPCDRFQVPESSRCRLYTGNSPENGQGRTDLRHLSHE